MDQMDDSQLPKANLQVAFHVCEKPSHKVHSIHPGQKQAQPKYGVVPVMGWHASSAFQIHNYRTHLRSKVKFQVLNGKREKMRLLTIAMRSRHTHKSTNTQTRRHMVSLTIYNDADMYTFLQLKCNIRCSSLKKGSH